CITTVSTCAACASAGCVDLLSVDCERGSAPPLRTPQDLPVGCLKFPVLDVLPGRPGEEYRLLEDDAYLAAEVSEAQIRYWIFVDQYPPRGWLIEPHEEVHNRGLPSPARSDDGNCLTRTDQQG